VRARLGGALLALCACAGALAGAAGAQEARLPQPPLGSFTETKGLAVDQGSHEVYAIDGRSEEQRIKVSATAGNAKLRFGAGEVEVAFNASAVQMETALRNLICPGGNCLFVNGGLATAGGSVVNFQTTLASADVEQIVCESGTPPLSGGTGCTVETTVNGVNGTIARYHANGTPSEFSALGSNRIDGGSPGSDQTPQGALHFDVARLVQIAVDDSGTATDGEIYPTQLGFHLVDIFSPTGEFKGQLTTYKEGLETKPLKNVCGVAVDPAGDVYVADFSTGIHKYDPSGDPVTNADSVANFTTMPSPCTLGAGAGPSASFLFASRLNAGLFKLDASTGEEKCELTGSATTVTVDPASGHALSATESQVREFEAKECPASQVGSIAAGSEVRGVAVDGSSGTGGTVYVSRAGLTHLDVYGPFVKVPDLIIGAAGPIAGTTVTLNGTISADNGPAASCHFEYLPKASFDAQEKAAKEAAEPKTKDQIVEAAFAGAQSAPCQPPGPFTGAGVNEVSAEASPLSPETEYEFRLVGENSNGQIAASPLHFETLGKPIVEGGSASGVTASTALISGAVNPRGLESEAAIEYASEEGFEESGFAAASIVPAPNLPGSATGSGDLSAATGTGDISAGSNQIGGLSVESGEIEVGQSIAAAGLPAGTTITKIEGAGLIALSKAATESGADVPYVASSNKVINLKTTAGSFGPGQSISGPGIPPGTTILTAQAGLLLLSNPLSEPHTAAALTATGPQPVAVKLSGLTPDTPYVFRIVALNSAGAADPGAVGSFATFPLLGPPLPDERAYELVTPAQKIGEPYVPDADRREGLGGSCKSCTPGWEKPRMPMQSSPEGDAVAFEGDPFEGGLASGANEYRARRGEGGWQTVGLSTPLFRDNSYEDAFKAFSTDLTKAVAVQKHGSLTPEAPEGFANLYLQEEGKEGLATLIDAEPPQRDENAFRVTFAGANAGTEAVASFSHVIFAANDALTPEEPGIAPPAPAVGAGEDDLYEWSGGTLHLVNVLPGNGEATANAVFGSGLLLAREPGNENFDFDHAISDDGSRIFWSKVPGGQVYVREGGTTTIEIPDPGRYITATPDGAKVLLDDGMLYDLQANTLTDLSGGAGGFEGLVGKSDDLARIYFVDSEALTPPEEENANHEAAKGGEPNLYLWEEGVVRFIARLLPSDDDNSLSKLGVWHAAPGDRLAQASPDGRFLAFESRAPITGYESTIAEGEGCVGNAKLGIPQCFEVFEYDAQEETLVCASCRPSGERPIGPSNLALIGGENGSLPQPQSLPPAGGGRLFFESQDPLTQRDSNGHIQDVYEWEPNGVGGCARSKGCLALISAGASPKDSHFLNASDTGNDAFFLTRDQLVKADKDDFLDLYDARVGGGFEEGAGLPCAGETCRGPISTAPPFEAPASSQGEGEGPVRRPACRRGYVRRHGRCVRKHHRRRHRRRRAPKQQKREVR
jgi:hypothetical protein